MDDVDSETYSDTDTGPEVSNYSSDSDERDNSKDNEIDNDISLSNDLTIMYFRYILYIRQHIDTKKTDRCQTSATI